MWAGGSRRRQHHGGWGAGGESSNFGMLSQIIILIVVVTTASVLRVCPEGLPLRGQPALVTAHMWGAPTLHRALDHKQELPLAGPEPMDLTIKSPTSALYWLSAHHPEPPHPIPQKWRAMLPSSSALASTPTSNPLGEATPWLVLEFWYWRLRIPSPAPRNEEQRREQTGSRTPLSLWGMSGRREDVGLSSRLWSVLGVEMEKWVHGVSMGAGGRELWGHTVDSPKQGQRRSWEKATERREESSPQVSRARRPRIDGEVVCTPRGLCKGFNTQTSHVPRSRMSLGIKAPRMSKGSPRLVGVQGSGAAGIDKNTLPASSGWLWPWL